MGKDRKVQLTKTVILSCTDGPDYIGYLPYVQKAWNLLGWNTLTFYLGKVAYEMQKTHTTTNKIIIIQPVPGYKDCTIVQCWRLLAHNFIHGLIMTGDVDMIPLSDYWQPNRSEVTVYGIDLTGDEQIPMCYVAMDADKWKEIIPEMGILELLSKYPQAASEEFNDFWFSDQRILTRRILTAGMPFTRIDRGVNTKTHLALGRIDRAAWEQTINESGGKIDAHMLRPFDSVQAERIFKMIKV